MNAKEIHQKGYVLLAEGKAQEALVLFNRALELMPDVPDFLSDRAVAYIHLGKLDLAMIDMNRAQEIEPENPYRYSSRAYLKDRIGDVKGGIEDYKRAIELDPEDAIAYNNLGLLEEKLGYKNQAKKYFDRADELADKNRLFGKTADGNEEAFVMIENESKPVIVEENTGDSLSPEVEKNKTRWSVIKSVFLSRSGRREFFQFIKSGFKIR